MTTIACKIFLCFLCLLLTVQIVNLIVILAGIYFMFLKERPRPISSLETARDNHRQNDYGKL